MRKFGWKRDSHDARDYLYSNHSEYLSAAPLPPSIDLRPLMSPIEDQGHMGSCVAHATCGDLEFLELQTIKSNIIAPENFGSIFQSMSRLFVYFNARSIDGDTNQDEGTQLRSAVMAIRSKGICRESLWPYDPSQVFNLPSHAAYDEGRKHKVLFAYKIDNRNLSALKQCLANGFPFIFGIEVFESFMSSEASSTGIIPLPSPGFEQFMGGHALCCVGYDEHHNFIVRNSWGVGWGMSGYCLIPQSYLLDPGLAADFWTLRKVSSTS